MNTSVSRINTESKRELAKAKTRQALLKSALRLYSDQGFQGLSMNKVAKGAGIAQPSFYNHFESLEALQSELCAQLKQGYISPMRVAWVDLVSDFDRLSHEDSLVRCQECIALIFDSAFQNIKLFQHLIEDRPRVRYQEDKGLGGLVVELQEEWANIFSQGLALSGRNIDDQKIHLFVDIAASQVHELILGCHARRYPREQAIEILSINFKQLFVTLFKQ